MKRHRGAHRRHQRQHLLLQFPQAGLVARQIGLSVVAVAKGLLGLLARPLALLLQVSPQTLHLLAGGLLHRLMLTERREGDRERERERERERGERAREREKTEGGRQRERERERQRERDRERGIEIKRNRVILAFDPSLVQAALPVPTSLLSFSRALSCCSRASSSWLWD